MNVIDTLGERRTVGSISRNSERGGKKDRVKTKRERMGKEPSTSFK